MPRRRWTLLTTRTKEHSSSSFSPLFSFSKRTAHCSGVKNQNTALALVHYSKHDCSMGAPIEYAVIGETR